MTPFGYHYPPGAEHDPSAPWNQEDCDETGETPTERRERIAEEKTDADYDRWKDEGGQR